MLSGIENVISRDIRPAVRRHKGDVELVGFDAESGVLTVRLSGTCVGCPLSRITLKVGILRMLRRSFPEVRDVVAEEKGVS